MIINKNFAYSLAEILIIIAIIGVVSAISIPTLIHSYVEKRTVSQLRETQAIISHAMKLAEEEYGEVEGWDIVQNTTSVKKVAKYLLPFLKISTDCGVLDSKKQCFGPAYYKLDDSYVADYAGQAVRYKVLLPNGTSVLWIVATDIDYQKNGIRLQFNIDTNGAKLPNTMGKDLFLFNYKNSTLSPMGAPDTLYPSDKYCVKGSNGSGCAYFVLHNKNMNYLKDK